MAALPDETNHFWFLEHGLQETPGMRPAADAGTGSTGLTGPTLDLPEESRPGRGKTRRVPPPQKSRWELGEFPGSQDDTLPGLGTIEQLGERFEMDSAPVSPAPAGTYQPPRPTRRRITEELPGPGMREAARRAVNRGRARHAFGPARQAWEARYVRLVSLGDVSVGLVAGGLAFALRFGDAVTAYNRGYLALSLVLPLALVLALALSRAYDRRLLFVGTDEYERVLRAGMALLALTAGASYLADIRLARGYVGVALPLATFGCLLLRFAVRKHLHHARQRGECLSRVIVVGHELAIVSITRQLRRERFHGFNIVGCCLPAGHDGQVGLPIYGTLDQVSYAVEAAHADTVIVLTCPELDGDALRRLAWKLERDDIDLIVASSLMDVAGARTTIRPVDGLPLLHVEHPRLAGGGRVMKSIVDRVGAFALLVLLSPVLAALALAVRSGSPGPVFFHQTRVGKHGREFRMHKFRTMHTDAEERLAELHAQSDSNGVMFKMRDDPRVTPAGRWLRRFSLDELPQLFNVLSGQMSLVGPRPPLPAEVAVYPSDMRRRLAVRPGLTGLWQVSGRADLSWEETVRLDLRYVENWSLSLDLVIMLRTIVAVCRGSGAY